MVLLMSLGRKKCLMLRQHNYTNNNKQIHILPGTPHVRHERVRTYSYIHTYSTSEPLVTVHTIYIRTYILCSRI